MTLVSAIYLFTVCSFWRHTSLIFIYWIIVRENLNFKLKAVIGQKLNKVSSEKVRILVAPSFP